MEHGDVTLYEEEGDLYQDLDLLQNHGINVADIKKLKSAGVCTVKGLQMLTKKKLCSIKGAYITRLTLLVIRITK